MKYKLLLFLLIFVFAASVSATDNSTISADGENILEAVDEISLEVSIDEDILADSQISVRDGDSIQSAIDRASPGSTIVVEKGTYEEDLKVSKELSLVGNGAVVKSAKTAFMILPDANNTSISGFDIRISDVNGTGIYINASGCRITDNKIAGGNIGIATDDYARNVSGEIIIRVINNTLIAGNNITNMNCAGISVNTYNPTVSRNRVTNVINTRENGTAIGIKINGIGIIADDLTVRVTDNYVSNVKSLRDSAYGLDVGGNSIFDTLTGFDVAGNIVKNILAAVEAYGVNIGIFSLNTTLPTIDVSDLDIGHISTSSNENASATGLSVSVTTIGQNDTSKTLIHDINVRDVKALGKNSKATGITTTGVGCVDLYVSDSVVKNIRATKLLTGISATGIEYTNFKAMIDVSKNNLTDLVASNINAINVVSLGNARINKNLIYDIKSDKGVMITGLTLSIDAGGVNVTIPQNATIDEIIDFIKNLDKKFNNTNFTVNGNFTAMGNNLEGSGTETGFAVIRPAEIHYNRGVNLKYNVIKDSTRRFILESYDYDPSMSNEELAYLLLKSQEMFENCTEEELRNMSVSMGAFLGQMFGNLDNATAGVVDARFNWWGSNSRPSPSKFRANTGSVAYGPWLVMTVRANPKVIEKGEYSKITVDVYTDSLGRDHSANARFFFSGPRVTLSSDLGSFNGKKSITLNWTNGKATAYMKGERDGIATVTASDYGNASTTVIIGGKNHNGSFYGEGSQIERVDVESACGNPVLMLVVVILMSLVGLYRKD
ncbi:right-handed parallel beta-helix repeat-containing protein [uncultured Methanobrevibacter sp.]|uniref:right-handed parallel beta-helix repeat-containing protein n=1 Tax=uncultured Methanobrevibacter sp. TaxID=253161 RepID=UPI0025E16901|nr:right-handed parallel beta-helix repeat-containing protein [uncultured Methanobrevibacter sp.]